MLALGMIEVYGRVGTIEGLDVALKAANVSLVNMIRVGGGLTSVFIEGDVGAVKAAIDAGASAAEKAERLCSQNVIPRPDKAVRNMLNMEVAESNLMKMFEKEEETSVRLQENSKREEKVGLPRIKNKDTQLDNVTNKKVTKQEEFDYRNDLNNMTVSQLRTLARHTEGFPMTKQEIKFAKKVDLIKTLKNNVNFTGGK